MPRVLQDLLTNRLRRDLVISGSNGVRADNARHIATQVVDVEWNVREVQ
jgi:hypothetical protein